MQTDATLPSVCALVTGAPVRGSWWSHPRGQDIFQVNNDLEDHPDVLMTKLISGKITYLDRALWPAVLAVGRAREPWQMDSLSRQARELLSEVDRKPVHPERHLSKAAAELEGKLLAYSEQFHSADGAHARRLESWNHWSMRAGFAEKRMTTARAKLTLEAAVAGLNQKFNGHGKLPWR